MKNFSETGLSSVILRAVEGEGYLVPTPIQAQTIPHEEFPLLRELLVVLRRAAFARPDARLGDRVALTRHGRKCSPVGGRVRVLPALGELARE